MGLLKWLKKSLFIIENEEKKIYNPVYVIAKKVSVGEFMIIARFCYNEDIKIRRVEKNVKFNSMYYQEKFLRPIKIEEFLFLHPNDIHSVNIHNDKTKSQTSKNFTAFLERLIQTPMVFYVWNILPLVY